MRGLTAKRYDRWLAVGLIMLSTLFFAGCKTESEPVNPFVIPGNTENPNWVITVENDMSASMTVIVKVAVGEKPGALAAFIGSECCGIGEYKEENGFYWLYVSPAKESTDVQLRFYSPELKRIFVARENIPFRNNEQIGSLADPHTPEWTAAQ